MEALRWIKLYLPYTISIRVMIGSCFRDILLSLLIIFSLIIIQSVDRLMQEVFPFLMISMLFPTSNIVLLIIIYKELFQVNLERSCTTIPMTEPQSHPCSYAKRYLCLYLNTRIERIISPSIVCIPT